MVGAGKQSLGIVPEEAQMLQWSDKDFKLAILNMFKELEETMFKELRERMDMTSHQIGNINEESDIIKKHRNCGVKKYNWN